MPLLHLTLGEKKYRVLSESDIFEQLCHYDIS